MSRLMFVGKNRISITLTPSKNKCCGPGRIASSWPALQYCAKHLECEQLAAAVACGQAVEYCRSAGNSVAVESGSKLLALQMLRAVRLRLRCSLFKWCLAMLFISI